MASEEDEDNELLEDFVKVLQDLLILQHSDGVEYSIKLSLNRDEMKLHWKGGRPVKLGSHVNDPRELYIKDIQLIQTGNDAEGFGPTLKAAHCCLTLYTAEGGEFNLIAASKVEREALATGFGMLSSKAQQAASDCIIS
jgi:hypothetical protein